MNKAHYYEHCVRVGLTATMISVLIVFATGCASQSRYDEPLAEGQTCPPRTTMKCYERASALDECFCANQGNIENTVESIMRRGPN